MIEIRLATSKDISEVYDLVKRLANYTGLSEGFTAPVENWQKDFEEGIFQVHIALDGAQPIGCAIHYPIYSTFKGKLLYLEDFFILEEYRRQGVGTRLFGAYKDYAGKTNCEGLKWQVLENNMNAHAFYKSYQAKFEKGFWNGKVLF